MTNLFSNNYLTRKPIEKAMKKFAQNFSVNQKVLDIGCGNMPYKPFFNCHYAGLDSDPKTKADIIAKSSKVPFGDNEFDGTILNQTLEHIADTKDAIAEITRILKPNGLCIVTAPQTVMTHGIPIISAKDKLEFLIEDYFRFTRYGLIHIFKDFEVSSIGVDTYFFGTIFQLLNYFFASLGLNYIFIPVYFINNLLGILLDKISFLFSKLPFSFSKKFRWYILEALPINNIIIFKKNG